MQNKEIEEAKKNIKNRNKKLKKNISKGYYYGEQYNIEKEINETEALLQYIDQLENKVKELEKTERDNFKLKIELENKRKEYQDTYKDVREELKELQSKANKYDNLVEKIKQKKRYFEEHDELISTSNDNYSDGIVIQRFIDTLQELLEEK